MEQEGMRYRASFVCAVLLYVGVASSGCDTLAPREPIVLPEKRVTFRFEFNSAGRSVGEPLEVVSNASADLADDLAREGFTKAEIISATVLSVELVRILPVGVNVSFLSEAGLALRSTGVARRTIARSTALPNDHRATIPVVDAGVTSYVTRPSFEAVLTGIPASLRPNEQYVLEATVRLRIEVEGV